MIGSFKTLAAAALLAVSLGSGACLAQSVNTDRPAPLTVVTKATYDQEILKADKPVIAIVVDGNSCSAVEALFEKAAQDHPEARFVKADAAEFGVPADKVPVMFTFAPVSSRNALMFKSKFTADPATFDAFITARIEAAAKANAAQKSINEAQAEVEKTIPRWQELYQNMRDEDKAERIALNDKLSKLMQQMADGHRAIAEVLESERKVSYQ